MEPLMNKVTPNEALDYIRNKKLKHSFNWHEIYADEHQHAFTVAKVMEADLLSAIYQKVDKAINDGESFYKFKKNLINQLGKSGWGNFKQKDEKTGEVITRLSDSRLRKIYHTNTAQAYHAGAWQRFERSKENLPYLQYKLGPSVRHREAHVQFKDLILKVDDPFWDTHMPMNGWGCKCWVKQLTEKQAQSMGISQSPKIEYHEWLNPSTGEIKRIPKGISPGFEYNVGRKRNQGNLALITSKVVSALYEQDSYQAVRFFKGLTDSVNRAYLDKAFSDWVVDIDKTKFSRGQTMIVGLIDDSVMLALEKLGKAPQHSIIAIRDEDIIHGFRDSKKAKGIALPLEFWQKLPQKLRKPDGIYLDKNTERTIIFLYKTDIGKIAVKLDYIARVKSEKKTVKLNIVRTGSILTDTAIKEVEDSYIKLSD